MAMTLCFNCNIALRANRQSFDILDMSPEMVSILEVWNDREVANADRLCEQCFDLVIAELNSDQRSPEQQVGHHSLCVSCGISVAPRSGRRSRPLPDGRPETAYIADIIFPREIREGARACNACWQRAHYRALQDAANVQEVHEPLPGDEMEMPGGADIQNLHEPLPEHEVDMQGGANIQDVHDPVPEHEEVNVPRPRANDPRIDLRSYSRTPDTPNHCFMPECTNVERLRVPEYLRRRILGKYKVFVTKNARVCEEHVSIYNWEELNEYQFMTEFTSSHIEEMLNILSKSDMDQFNFEHVESMSESLCRFWTGLTVLHFLTLFNNIILNNITVRRKKTALALFLIKTRTGESYARISSIFNITASVVISYTNKIRNCLKSNYVPFHLGTRHISREALSLRNLLIPQGLFGTEANNPIAIFDGTYIYVQKSSNYLFQKKTYSLHKLRNLVKPFLVVATDGHILDVFGPYPAVTSDADIMKQLFENPDTELRRYFRPNDVFILDRGFRDSIGLLTSLGYSIYKPESRSVNEGSQLSTLKANKSRMVTMCRWVVEIVNGRFKRDYKIFRANYFNRMSKHLMDDFKICAALMNNFHPVLTDRPDAELILQRAVERLHMPNHLAEYVERHNLNRRRANFIRIDGQLPQLDMFPVMEMSDLILFSLGTYQIKQARSYYGEHIRTNGRYVVEVNDNINSTIVPGISSSTHETVLIRGRIKSRHLSNTVYYTYLLIKISGSTWRDKICGYYCSCIIGKRTVGSCAHVMTVVWYLGWARHQDTITAPATLLDHIFVSENE